MAELRRQLSSRKAVNRAGGGDAFQRLLVQNPSDLGGIFRGSIVRQVRDGNNELVAIDMEYTLEGQQQTATISRQDRGERNRQIVYRVIRGDLMRLYSYMVITSHVETGGGVDFITWTIEYELLNANYPPPYSLLTALMDTVNPSAAPPSASDPRSHAPRFDPRKRT